MEFYTNVFPMGNKLCVRGYDNGQPYKHKLDFNPTLYASSKSKNSSEEIFFKQMTIELTNILNANIELFIRINDDFILKEISYYQWIIN